MLLILNINNKIFTLNLNGSYFIFIYKNKLVSSSLTRSKVAYTASFNNK